MYVLTKAHNHLFDEHLAPSPAEVQTYVDRLLGQLWRARLLSWLSSPTPSFLSSLWLEVHSIVYHGQDSISDGCIVGVSF
ncbi:hypothetical protein A0H81_07557 [Grifola frondosa]|uniref:Uncharacterized protein n=1 Tax=Grifola frondosa TaxID=5627 RepID=A0A1C7M526_GRIFR|nr:hypothetical protein A0H81_07557 [Grifola frondosa]